MMFRAKKLVAALTCALLTTGTAACTSSDDGRNAGKESAHAEVLTTFTILEDMAQEIAGDTLTVRSLTSPGAEIHGYEPTPSDVAAAEKAQLIINNGLGLEHWLGKLTAHSDAQQAVATQGITPIPIADTDTPNPHAWMSPTLALKYVDNITDALSELKPEHADEYHDNARAYKDRIQHVNHELLSGLANLPTDHRALMTCEGAFSYLARDAQLKEGYIWPVNTDGDITAGQISQAAQFVEKNHVPAVFCESTVEPGPKEQLIRDTGAADGGTLYVDSLSGPEGPVPSYLDLLRYDTHTIVDGLSKASAGQEQQQ